ncbi:MAG: CopG family transcriptional regulator [Steroidobacteraceae bacterium]
MVARVKLAKLMPKTVRASVSFPKAIYEDLGKLATAKKVSLAWVVRDAAEKYVAEQWPLFANPEQDRR